MSLARLDPRPKLLFVLCVSTLAVLWRDPAWLAALLGLTIVVLLAGGVDPRSTWGQVRGVLQVVAILFVVQCVFVRSGEPVVSVAGFTAGHHGRPDGGARRDPAAADRRLLGAGAAHGPARATTCWRSSSVACPTRSPSW